MNAQVRCVIPCIPHCTTHSSPFTTQTKPMKTCRASHLISALLILACCAPTDAFQLFQRSREPPPHPGSETSSGECASSSQDTSGLDVDAALANVKGLMHSAIDNLRTFEQSFFSMVPAIEEKRTTNDVDSDTAPLSQLFSRIWARSAMDVVETDRDITFTADVPGIDASSLHVDVVSPSNILTIRGEREKVQGERSGEKVLTRTIQRHSGRFVNKYILPREADLDSVTATIKNGVLVVRVAKSEKEKTRVRRVQISTEGEIKSQGN